MPLPIFCIYFLYYPKPVHFFGILSHLLKNIMYSSVALLLPVALLFIVYKFFKKAEQQPTNQYSLRAHVINMTYEQSNSRATPVSLLSVVFA